MARSRRSLASCLGTRCVVSQGAVLLVGMIVACAAAAPAIRLTDVTSAEKSVTSFQLQDGHAVVMVGPGKAEPNQLLGVALDGATAPVVLNDPAVPGADPLRISTYKFKPAEPGTVLFFGNNAVNSPEGAKYFQASVVAPAMTRELTDVERRIYFGSTVRESDYTHEYVVRPDGEGIRQIYRVPLLGDGPELQLTAHTQSEVNILSMRLLPGEEFLQYRADGDISTAFDLYSVRADGSSPAAKLSAVGATADVSTVIPTADGLRTTYEVDSAAAPRRNLYIAPSDGSAPAERLDNPVHGDAEFIDYWRFTPDESRVLYVTRSSTLFAAAGLYSVSTTDPSGDHFRISSDPFGYGRTISEMFITPGGERTVYSAFLKSSQATDLFAASTSEPGTQIQLNTRQTPAGDVGLVKLIQNGERVVYRGDMDTASHFELYAASTDQPGTQIRISGPVANSATSILSYQLSPDQTHVVYEKQSPGRNVDDLFSAQTSTTNSEVVLLQNDTYTHAFSPQMDASSSWVVASVQTTSHANKSRPWLFAVPIGGGVPVRLNDPVPEGGTIGQNVFTPDGSAVAFTATRAVHEQGAPGCPGPVCSPGIPNLLSNELYVTPLPAAGGIVGDMDGNGVVDAADLLPFALGIVNPRNFAFRFGLAPVNFGDLNDDGAFNALDAPLFATEAGVSIETILNAIAQAGDYNDDGMVDAADYVVWRNAKGTSAGALPNDVDGGPIGDAQYFTWKANFGSQVGGAGAAAAVPEPATLWLLAAVVAIAANSRWRRRQAV